MFQFFSTYLLQARVARRKSFYAETLKKRSRLASYTGVLKHRSTTHGPRGISFVNLQKSGHQTAARVAPSPDPLPKKTQPFLYTDSATASRKSAGIAVQSFQHNAPN